MRPVTSTRQLLLCRQYALATAERSNSEARQIARNLAQFDLVHFVMVQQGQTKTKKINHRLKIEKKQPKKEETPLRATNGTLDRTFIARQCMDIHRNPRISEWISIKVWIMQE